MNMKNEEKIYQLNTYNIAEYTSTDYTDNDIAILGDFKNLLFNKAEFNLQMQQNSD